MMPLGRGLMQHIKKRLAVFYKEELYTLLHTNMKALGFLVFEKTFYVFPIESYRS